MTAEEVHVQQSPASDETEASPASNPRVGSYRGRALTVLSAIALAVGVWWASGYLFAYTDDAYVTSDLVSITPEVTGLIQTTHPGDHPGPDGIAWFT